MMLFSNQHCNSKSIENLRKIELLVEFWFWRLLFSIKIF